MRALLLTCIICASIFASLLLVTHAVGQHIIQIPFFSVVESKEQQCFNKSYQEINELDVALWDSLMQEDTITSAFGAMLFFINFFSELKEYNTAECISLAEIQRSRHSNARSSTFATCAILQKYGWDVQCFYNDAECYLGISLTDDWKVRKANWVEKDGKAYYLKEFNLTTALGELISDDPAATYRSLTPNKEDLRAVPIINELPRFTGPVKEKEIVWFYNDLRYAVTVSIYEQQIEWTRNLPPSLYGMARVGIEELNNIRLPDTLMAMIAGFNEFDRVNFLFKLSQSESIFIYDSKQPIKSVSQQLLDGRNDCDGRSVFLYSLLRATLGYTGTEIVFLSWPNHIALGLRPKTAGAIQKLEAAGGYYTGDRYYILDAAFTGNTFWGSKMERLTDVCEIVR